MTAVLFQMFTLVADWHRRRSAVRELSDLSDFMLRDIGLVRADIPRLVDEALEAERAARVRPAPARVPACSHESTGLC